MTQYIIIIHCLGIFIHKNVIYMIQWKYYLEIFLNCLIQKSRYLFIVYIKSIYFLVKNWMCILNIYPKKTVKTLSTNVVIADLQSTFFLEISHFVSNCRLLLNINISPDEKELMKKIIIRQYSNVKVLFFLLYVKI